MTVLIVLTVGTLPLHNLVPYVYWKNSQWLGNNCNYEKWWFQIMSFVIRWADFYCDFLWIYLMSVKNPYRQTKITEGVVYWIDCWLKLNNCTVFTKQLYWIFNTVHLIFMEYIEPIFSLILPHTNQQIIIIYLCKSLWVDAMQCNCLGTPT